MFIIPLIASFGAFFGIIVVGGTVFCYKPYCCDDDYVYYETTASYSDIDSD